MEKPCPVCPKKTVYSEDDLDLELEKYINILKPTDRASDELYQQRLAICNECEYKSKATCTMCGCLVKIRCIVKNQKCPAKNKRW